MLNKLTRATCPMLYKPVQTNQSYMSYDVQTNQNYMSNVE